MTLASFFPLAQAIRIEGVRRMITGFTRISAFRRHVKAMYLVGNHKSGGDKGQAATYLMRIFVMTGTYDVFGKSGYYGWRGDICFKFSQLGREGVR